MADNVNEFRGQFKRYKQRKPPPDFSDVIDYQNQNSWKNRVKECGAPALNVSKQDLMQLGLKPLNTWRCYELVGCKGFKVIVNPFTKVGQLQWIRRCLEIYPGKPNVSNLDAHMELRDEQNLWNLYVESQSNKISGSLQQNAKQHQTLMDQLRWVTLGYHYNWDSKLYSKDVFTPFPSDLENLTKFIGKVMGYPDFVPEAAIVNYYHMDSTLSGHRDHSELDLTAPLFSISFGQTCIFLLGTQSLSDVPSAMFLRSGDIVVMSDETRLAYHAVPKIIPDNDVVQITTNDELDHTLNRRQNMEILGNYLSYSRINVNVRQVEGPGGCFPLEAS